jgi:hypothetical protein
MLGVASSTEATLALSLAEDITRNLNGSPRDGDASGAFRTEAKGQRTQKHRSSGAFLLHDALDDRAEGEPSRRARHSRKHHLSTKGKGSARASDQSYSNTSSHDFGLGIDSTGMPRGSTASPEPQHTANLVVPKRDSAPTNGRPPEKAPPAQQPSAPPLLDVDSAQIVNMALNLSESRRIASRRNVSQPIPPRLAPLPDSSMTGSLRQHLQQQRKASRTVSPRPDRGVLGRSASGQRVSSPLQNAFDDGSYRYHFTPSTLARAQKAKEHLELMAQYRRMLEFVPPIKRSAYARSLASSPPSSPNAVAKVPTFGSPEVAMPLGRHYNPLQYIRNRKVRARERKGIDGEGQGFGDVLKVTGWVDEVARWAATGQYITPNGIALPPFADTNEDDQQTSPSSAAVKPSTRPKRPRVDWAIDPADMIADTYWVEQNGNRHLVEDRHWRRIIPRTSDLYRPLSRQTEEANLKTPPRPTRQDLQDPDSGAESKFVEPKLIKTETEHSHSSARERARQKIQDLKGLHHRHNSSVHSHHDFFRHRRGSTSDLSDSDNDHGEKRARSGTITSNSKDILEKQMQEMMAREAREAELLELEDPEANRRTSGPLLTPEAEGGAGSKPTSRFHSRMGSVVDVSESDEKSARERTKRGSPHRHRPGRASLDVPMHGRRPSMDIDTTAPSSPDMRPSRADAFVPTIGMDLSPPTSRPGSPTRNPFTKVKQIFRDRSRERGSDLHSDEKEDHEVGLELKETVSESADLLSERKRSPDRRGSKSPVRKVQARGTGESHKSHRSIGSLRLRGDDQNVRSLFRGARIDTVIRGGVSKLGELIWRKETLSPEVLSEDTSTDNSDEEQTRGRRRNSLKPPPANSRRGRDERHPQGSRPYLDVVPTFRSTAEGQEQTAVNELELLVPGANGGTLSRSSSRFDMLKPPRIDVQAASPSSSSPPVVKPHPQAHDSDNSDADSRTGSYNEGVRAADARLNTILSVPPSFASSGRHRPSMSGRDRHWSISDRSPSPHRVPISKREVARLKALILSSGIKAMEITRRAHEPRLVFATDRLSGPKFRPSAAGPADDPIFSWSEIAAFSTDPGTLQTCAVAQTELYSLAARTLGASIQATGQTWQANADTFAGKTAPGLQRKVDSLRSRLAIDLTQMGRAAADEADETARDLALSQRLKIKRVVDVIEKMLRRRRRRFRWVRRALWLAVEWVLVGIMWYVWFVVMILRVFLGVGQGVVRGVRWLLWL